MLDLQGELKSIMAIVTSCRSDMSPQGLSRNAHLADGRMHLVLVHKCSILEYLRFLSLIPTCGRSISPDKLMRLYVITAAAMFEMPAIASSPVWQEGKWHRVSHHFRSLQHRVSGFRMEPSLLFAPEAARGPVMDTRIKLTGHAYAAWAPLAASLVSRCCLGRQGMSCVPLHARAQCRHQCGAPALCESRGGDSSEGAAHRSRVSLERGWRADASQAAVCASVPSSRAGLRPRCGVLGFFTPMRMPEPRMS